jgi:hypothetical protein
MFRRLLPDARLVSLYDDYNTSMAGQESMDQAEFSAAARQNFKNSLIELFKTTDVVAQQAVEGEDFLLIQESAQEADAKVLVAKLEARGLIERSGSEIYFVNDTAENPLYHRICLRTRKGRWLCVTLDTSTYLKKENLDITHIVVLPEYMKTQQDKAWEILRVLGVEPIGYHNIFYNPTLLPRHVARVVEREFVVSSAN